jgi:hypothetical protein
MEPILQEQFSIPEDNDYGKHEKTETFNLINFVAGSFFWLAGNSRRCELDA